MKLLANVGLFAVSLVLQLDAMALSGVVKDESGAPLANATVTIQKDNSQAGEIVTFTDKSGEYGFEATPNGIYYVEARRRGFLSVRYHPIYLQYPKEKLVNFTLPLDLEEAWLQEVLPPSFYAHATVSGELIVDGKRADNVRLCASGGPGRFCTFTNGLGQYSFEIPPGLYDFQAYVGRILKRFPQVNLNEPATEYVDVIGDKE